MISRLFTATLAVTVVLAVAQPAHSQDADPIVAQSSIATVRLSELRIELERLPANIRDEFAATPTRLGELLSQILVRKALASQARADKLELEPSNQQRIAAGMDGLLAQFRLADVEQKANADFDARIEQHRARAREAYLVDREKYRTPEEVSASHILFTTDKRSSDEARALAEKTRARLVAGEDFALVAREVSDDPSAASNGGSLGWFVKERMDPAFSATAFGLKTVGELSQPVQSRFGWHIIRLDGHKPSAVPPFEEVAARLLEDMRAKAVAQARDAVLNPIRSDPKKQLNEPALDKIVEEARSRRVATPAPAKPVPGSFAKPGAGASTKPAVKP